MTRTIDDTATDQALKGKHRAIWALGDYAAVAADVVAPLGPVLVEATVVRPGQRVLDIAAGSGNAAIPAAARGAQVVASDLTPGLLDRAVSSRPPRGSAWSGRKRTPRRCPTTTRRSTRCCPAWA
jgi:2-polyprenyl-6-hydroxyphenyl methylase/3-demethylubiquinone-9 3-methyltransferase